MTDLCFCGRDRRSHTGLAHEYSTTGTLKRKDDADDSVSSSSAIPGDAEVETRLQNMPNGDPILRMVLIRAGLITADQLTEVENELKATGISYS